MALAAGVVDGTADGMGHDLIDNSEDPEGSGGGVEFLKRDQLIHTMATLEFQLMMKLKNHT